MNSLQKTFTKATHNSASETVRKHARSSWWQRNKWRFKVVVLSFVSLCTAFALTIWWFWDQPLVSPLNSLSMFQFLPITEFSHGQPKVIYGFLPYWNVNKVTIQPELTHLGYFSLTIGADGSLLTRTADGGEPGFTRLNSEEFTNISADFVHKNGSMELVLAQFNADDIQAFLNSPTAQDNLITTLDSVLLAYPFSGINIDIELNGSASQHNRDNLTAFVKKLRQHLNTTYDKVGLSIDMYASAATAPHLWDVAAIEPHVDYIIVMAYDFHQRSSPQAGPVAPLFGGKELWDSDINSHLREFLKVVPASKILLGVPFYGYEWQTTSRDSQSHTFPDTGSTASIERVTNLLEQKEALSVEEHWNEDALSPYLSYLQDGEIYVIYYENSRSISYKLDYVNQLDLGGIAIWALGYEGDSRELWDVVNRKIEN